MTTSNSSILFLLFVALTAFLILGSFLEEGEGLSNSGGSKSARAALDFRNTVGVLTNELTLGFGAVGLVAFPVASRFFADGFTFRLGGLAVSDAVGLLADGDTLGAVEHFAAFIRAFDFALGFLALYVANGIFGFSTGSVALGRFADGVANGGAVRVIAFPRALGMALKG